MASIGSLTVDLAMEAANFLASTKKAAEATESMAHRIEAAMDLAKEATTAFVGAWSVERVAEMIDQSVEFGARMIDLSNKTGVSTDTIQKFTYAMKQNGGSAEGAETALNKFAKSIGAADTGNQKISKTLSKIGVDSWKSYDDALQQVMGGLEKLPSIADKNAVAQTLFGKSASAVAAMAKEGAGGYSELADEASTYGIVLDREVLSKGKEAEDKISSLKQILAADISNAVLTNADGIAKFVDGLISLVAEIPKVLSGLSALQNYFDKLNLDRPAWMTDGIAFGKDGIERYDGKIDSEHRLLGNHDGREAIYDKYSKLYNDMVRQGQGNTAEAQGYRGKAIYAKHLDAMGEQKTPPPTGLGGGGKITPPKEKKQKEADPKYFDKQFESAQNALYSAQLGLATDADKRFEIQTAMLEADRKAKDQAIQDDRKLTDAQKAKLVAMNDQTVELKEQLLANEKFDAFTQKEADIAIEQNGYKEDQLKSDLDLAKTMNERRRIQLELLAKETEDKRIAYQAVIDKFGASPDDKANAQRHIDQLNRQQANQAAVINKSTQGPLENYMDQIKLNADQMNEALQNVEVEGLQNLGEGLLDVVKGTESVGQAFSKMAMSIVDDLAKIVIEETILAPLAGLFGGGGGLLGGLFGGSNFAAPSQIGVAGFSIPISGARANGGMTDAGTYLVGERGPELVNIGASANVTTNRQLVSANDNPSHQITFGPNSIVSNDPERVRAMVVEGIASALPVITKQSTDRTLKQAARRTL